MAAKRVTSAPTNGMTNLCLLDRRGEISFHKQAAIMELRYGNVLRWMYNNKSGPLSNNILLLEYEEQNSNHNIIEKTFY
jgi:hypothetical protein